MDILENVDLSTLSEDAANEVLNTLLELNNDDLKKKIENIIDNIDNNMISEDKLPLAFDVIFSHEKIQNIINMMSNEIDKLDNE